MANDPPLLTNELSMERHFSLFVLNFRVFQSHRSLPINIQHCLWTNIYTKNEDILCLLQNAGDEEIIPLNGKPFLLCYVYWTFVFFKSLSLFLFFFIDEINIQIY